MKRTLRQRFKIYRTNMDLKTWTLLKDETLMPSNHTLYFRFSILFVQLSGVHYSGRQRKTANIHIQEAGTC